MIKHPWRWWEIVMGMALIGAAVFGRGLMNEFVLDDGAQLTDNVLVHSLKYIPNLWFGSTFYAGSNLALQGLYYRPVMMLIFSLLYQFFTLRVWPYHLIQLALHIANASLGYFILKKFIKPGVALVAATLFLVHPINAEAVIYISNLQDVLLAHFGLWALWFMLYQKKTWSVTKRWSVVLVCLELSLLSKEVGVLWVMIVWGYVWYWEKAQFKRYLTGGLAVMAVYTVLRLHAIGWPSSDRVIPIAAASLGERLLTIPRIWWYYLSLFFYPGKMAIAQNWVVRHWSWVQVGRPLIQDLCLIGLIGWLLVWSLKRQTPLRKVGVWLGGWVIAGMLIHSQLFPLDVTVADRWFYTPSLALITLILLIVQSAQSKVHNAWSRVQSTKYKGHNVVLTGGVLVIVGILAVRTFIRVGDWRTAYGLYSHDYAISGSSFTIDNNLGLEYLKRGDLDHAKIYLTRSVQAVDRWGISWNNLGIAYELAGDQDDDPTQYLKAQAAYLKAIQYPAGYSAFLNLGRLLVEKLHDAQPTTQTFLRNSLQLYPENPDLWYLLSEWEDRNGTHDQAMAAAIQFEHYFPGEASTHWFRTISTHANGTTNYGIK